MGKEIEPKAVNVLQGVLAFCSLIVLVMCIANSVLIIRNGRFKNIALAWFYFFSFLTLACKSYLQVSNVALIVYFLDPILNLNECSYSLFQGLPTFAYAACAYSYILNW